MPAYTPLHNTCSERHGHDLASCQLNNSQGPPRGSNALFTRSLAAKPTTVHSIQLPTIGYMLSRVPVEKNYDWSLKTGPRSKIKTRARKEKTSTYLHELDCVYITYYFNEYNVSNKPPRLYGRYAKLFPMNMNNTRNFEHGRAFMI